MNKKLIKQLLSDNASAFILDADKIRGITGIEIDILEFDKNANTIRILVKQSECKNDIFLPQSELRKRGQDLIRKHFGTAFKLHYVITPFEPNFEGIDLEFVTAKMNEYDLKQLDVCKQIGLDKSSFSLIMSGERGLTRSMKALFYYYFKQFEITRRILNNYK